MDQSKRALGAYGEDRVARWYTNAGYDIVARNWRCTHGELDLVCRRDATVVFCEVKTRATTAFGLPAEAVTITKQRRLRRLAAAWLDAECPRGVELRFDVASVVGGKIEIIENAF